jgi:hypothetical protein
MHAVVASWYYSVISLNRLIETKENLGICGNLMEI